MSSESGELQAAGTLPARQLDGRLREYGEPGLGKSHPIALAAFVLWRLNYIHPFINGNGRTARAACYFVLCLKTGSWLGGEVILPERLAREKDKYVDALKHADASGDLGPLCALLMGLLEEQFSSNQ